MPLPVFAASFELVVISRINDDVWPLPTDIFEEQTWFTKIQVSQPSGKPVISRLMSSSILALLVISTLKVCVSPGPAKDSISTTSILN